MSNKHTTLRDLFTNIANAIRRKTGSTESIVADDFPDAIDALPSGKTSYTINLDWSMDEELLGEIYYISNGESIHHTSTSGQCPDVIEADNGSVYIVCGDDSYFSDEIVIIYGNGFGYSLIATEDGGTITFISGSVQ